jgi:hypothetical protein
MRTLAFTLVLSYIYGLVALLDITQSSFSSITISTIRIEEIKTRQQLKLFQSRNLLCYTRE